MRKKYAILGIVLFIIGVIVGVFIVYPGIFAYTHNMVQYVFLNIVSQGTSFW